MVYAYTQDVPIGPEMYQRCLDEIGPEPLAGSLVHLCVRLPEGGLRYIDVWESEEACARAFDERIHPPWTARSAGPAHPANPRCTDSTSSTSAGRPCRTVCYELRDAGRVSTQKSKCPRAISKQRMNARTPAATSSGTSATL